MKKCVISCIAAVAALAVAAAPARSSTRVGVRTGPGASAKAAQGGEGKARIEQFPRPGRQSTLNAPHVEGGSTIGNNVYSKSSTRRWIVLEAKYETFDNWTDQLNFTWHVMLDADKATEKDKEDRGKIARFSYYTVTVSYMNIPRGTHAASVCLPPACLERFGEPGAIGIVITNRDGEPIVLDVQSEIKGIDSHPKSIDEAFWNNKGIMEKEVESKNGERRRLVEQRQGLLDRSKTIWALVNPNDYEQVVQ